ncbi:MAG: ABC transporter permease [Candidatus Rokubacteria bacterium RIFCSPLOWO2_02_FULL_72_37]|nr:MAG: ABC transporter permease [Candidatus Rokubacteria bacterium RIFCSPLOWO2_02_FULL_72_37]
MPRRRRGAMLAAHVLLAAATLVIVFPMLYAVQVSTLEFQEVFVFPPKLLPGAAFTDNLQRAWEKVHLGRLLANSAGIAVAVALGKTCLSVLAAFAFTYFRDFPGKTLLFVAILVTHMLPLPVRIVPTFQLMHDFGWVNSYQALTVPFFASATGTLLFRQFFLTIPPALSEAARVDGAGPLRFLVRILLPLSLNNLAALFLVEFLYMWNEYLWPLIVTTSDEMRVVQIGIKMLVATDAQAEWNLIMAGVVAAMVPPLLVLLALQRSFVRSISLGQEK